MASLGDLTLFVSAETNRARQDLQKLDQEADRVASKDREIGFSLNSASNSIRQFQRDLKDVRSAIQTTFKVAKNTPFFDDEIEAAQRLAKTTARVPGVLREGAQAANVLKASIGGATEGAIRLTTAIANVGLGLFGLQQIAGILSSAFGGFFKSTIGQEIALREQILKTQTALASTNDVFANGRKIEKPYEAIVALTGAIEDRIDSIRLRSLDLAGVTSGQVVEVFGMVAQQIGAIGGSLSDAEDLAIAFSGALGTFGIPLYQARQEIGSILRGDITTDSYLAKALGITNEDVRKAKQTTEGIVGFLNKRLETAVAGQAIAARSFSGVTSNLLDLAELVQKEFGKPFVDPLVNALNEVYNRLVGIKDQALDAAKALGTGFAQAVSFIGTTTGAKANANTGGKAGFDQAGAAAAKSVERIGTQIAALAAEMQTVISNILLLIGQTFGKLFQGLKELASGFASLKVEVFKQLAQVLQNVLYLMQPMVDGTVALLSAWGEFMKLPLVQYFSSLAAQMKLLEVTGIAGLIKMGIVAIGLVAKFGAVKAALQQLGMVIGSVVGSAVAAAGAALQAFGIALDALLTRLKLANPQLAALATSFQATGASAVAAGNGMKAAGIGAGVLGGGIAKLMLATLKFNAILLLIQVSIAYVVDAFGRWQRAQEKVLSDKRAAAALKSLNNELKDVTENSSAAARAQKELADSIVTAKLSEQKNAFQEADKKVEELTEKVKKLKQELKDREGLAFGLDVQGIGAIKTLLGQAEQELQKAVGARFAAEKEYVDNLTEYEKTKKKETLQEEITTRAKSLGDQNEKLAKQQTDLARSVANAEFSARMELARRELDLFKTQEELRIQMVEDRNRKLIEGEEGASAEALDALNTYIGTKQRGEMEIEARRREMVMRTAELEKELENYKYDIAQKILELKKQGAKIDMDAADYVKKQQELAALGGRNGVMLPSGNATARVGNTGTSTGAHLDIRGPNAEKVIDEAEAIIRAWQQMGVKYIHLSNIKKDILKVTDSGELRRLLKLEQEAHDSTRGRAKGASSGAIDIAVPEGTPIPVPVGPVSFDQKAGYFAQSQFGLGNRFLHLQKGSKASGATANATRPSLDTPGMAAPSTTGFENAKRGALEVQGVIDGLQGKLQDLANNRNFEAVINKMAPKILVERYDDAKLKAESFMKASLLALDPAKAEVYADKISQLAILERELQQAVEGINKANGLTREEKDRLIEQGKKAFYGPGGTKEQLEFELKKRLELLEVEKAAANVRGLAQDTLNSRIGTQNQVITGKAAMQAGTEFSTFDQRRIQAQGAIDARYNTLTEGGTRTLSPEEMEAFKQFSEQELVSAEQLGALDGLQQRFQQLSEVSAGVGSAIGTAMTKGVADVLTGASTVQETLSNMFQSIGDSFMQLAQKIIADMIKMIVLKSLLGLFGGGGGGGGAGDALAGFDTSMGSLAPGSEGIAAGLPNFAGAVFNKNGNVLVGGFQAFAKGGVVNKPTLGLVGEGSYNEAIVPLPNGKAIPVDMKGQQANNVNTNITVNVDNNGGTQTEMSGEQAGKLGKAIDNAVKRVILEERRPGGMLSGR